MRLFVAFDSISSQMRALAAPAFLLCPCSRGLLMESFDSFRGCFAGEFFFFFFFLHFLSPQLTIAFQPRVSLSFMPPGLLALCLMFW